VVVADPLGVLGSRPVRSLTSVGLQHDVLNVPVLLEFSDQLFNGTSGTTVPICG
jgi:hypothetical protein